MKHIDVEAEIARLRADGWEEVTDPRAFAQYELLGRRWNGPRTSEFMATWDDVPDSGFDREAMLREMRRLMRDA